MAGFPENEIGAPVDYLPEDLRTLLAGMTGALHSEAVPTVEDVEAVRLPNNIHVNEVEQNEAIRVSDARGQLCAVLVAGRFDGEKPPNPARVR